ncbi:MAG: thiamine phosphate synthase [Thermoplasmata archaeon]|jgi:thiamine-phosphate pyrophosphorylase|nr:thiamine phosphate synthase [Thermoplasmatales archaeon]
MNLPSGIYGITSRDFGHTHVESAEILLRAGIRIIQYREKNASTRTMLDEARKIKNLCREYGAIFIVNDRMDIALAVEADGIHVGQDDMPLSIVKKFFNGIVGVSASNISEALEAQKGGADYLGVGSIFPTGTKKDSEVIGLEVLGEIAKSVRIPIYAIGGITLENLRELKKFNIHGVAVISAILGSNEPISTARKFLEEWGR